MIGCSRLNAGGLRACRRLLLLIYATAVVYFFYAPWNYLLLAALLFRLKTPNDEFGTLRRATPSKAAEKGERHSSRNGAPASFSRRLRKGLGQRLLELGGNAGERCSQIGAKGVDGSNDSDRDAGRDKTIFDGGRTAVVIQETSNKRFHPINSLKRSCAG
jgi:hypothetical protein